MKAGAPMAADEGGGLHAHEIDPSCERMLADIGHPYARGEKVYDIAFENAQAGERTSHLFQLANMHGGFVVGTGDLSELALGWCTCGVGDRMSHCNVNASVPKTLIKHLVRWVAGSGALAGDTAVLEEILDTQISPELIPGDQNNDAPSQGSEDVVGPYELQDFHLYQILRYGYAPQRHLRASSRRASSSAHACRMRRRSARAARGRRGGNWRAPSDAQAVVLLGDVERIPQG